MMLEPAASIISRLGGVRAVSTATGVYRTRVYAWMYPKERGGTGGLVPQRHHPVLLEFAAREGVTLTAADFLPSSMNRAA